MSWEEEDVGKSGLAGIVVFVFIVWLTINVFTKIGDAIDKNEARVQAELAQNGFTCPDCVYVPEGLQRIESVLLIEGGTVPLPTPAYLAHLYETCANRREDGNNCYRRLREIKFDVNDVYSRVSPLYGRPSFNAEQIKYVQSGAKRVGELLAGFEYWFIGSQRENYFRNKDRSS